MCARISKSQDSMWRDTHCEMTAWNCCRVHDRRPRRITRTAPLDPKRGSALAAQFIQLIDFN